VEECPAAPWKTAVKKTIASMIVLLAVPASGQTVPGSMDVQWDAGAADCAATPQEPLQVHAYEPQTFILRQNPCADFEANFIYLLVGSERALLIDTGAVADPALMPLAKTVLDLLPEREGSKIPLIVAHSHGHRDHRAGDPQFASLRSVQVVATDPASVRAFFGFDAWPGTGSVDLGDRTIRVVAAPGHHPSQVIFHDERTGLVLTGDFLLPGRLLVDDAEAYRESALRVIDFLGDRPVTHVLGGHIELDTHGDLYAHGSRNHPDERRLEMAKADLLALPTALGDFNGFYSRYANFAISNPVRNLSAMAIAALAVLVSGIWSVVRLLRRRRNRKN
jgi:glyoxylase-like metal-dependent hydrolase (beta-lactamase superfamily II)